MLFYIALHVPYINMSNITERHITENFCREHKYNIVLMVFAKYLAHLLVARCIYIHISVHISEANII